MNSTVTDAARLAIEGGEPVRKKPMPARIALGDAEAAAIAEVLTYYRERELDPGYEGAFEKRYTEAFVKWMGGGYADAVATGTASLYIAVAALRLPAGSEVIVSPITDPGSLAAIVLNGLVPRLADSAPGTYNMGVQQFAERVTPKVRAVMVVHSMGRAADVAGIVAWAHARDIRVIEDCSQSQGAKVKGRVVGNFGDIAAFSTMYRKAHMTGASGGVGSAATSTSTTMRWRMRIAANRAGATTSRIAIPINFCSRRSICTPMKFPAGWGWRR